MLWCSLWHFPGDSCSFPFSSLCFLLQQRRLTEKGRPGSLEVAQNSSDLALRSTATPCPLCPSGYIGINSSILQFKLLRKITLNWLFLPSSQHRVLFTAHPAAATHVVHSHWAETSTATAPLTSGSSCQLCVCTPFNMGIVSTEH